MSHAMMVNLAARSCQVFAKLLGILHARRLFCIYKPKPQRKLGPAANHAIEAAKSKSTNL